MATPCCTYNITISSPTHHTIVNAPIDEDSEAVVFTAKHQDEVQNLYQPLKSGQTRLIRLRTVHEGPLTADIIVVDLHRPGGATADEGSFEVPYNALSYVHGSQELTDVIKCNGIMVPITKHLATILCCIQHSPRGDHWLWVDAICINQRDSKEKAGQLTRVLDIYSNAGSVIAWLGPADMDGLLAFTYLEAHRHIYDRFQVRYSLGIDVNFDVKYCAACISLTETLHKTLIAMCERPWFKRVWTRSEMFAAKDVIAMIGTGRKGTRDCIYKCTPWDNFLHLKDLVLAAPSIPLHPPRHHWTLIPNVIDELHKPPPQEPRRFSSALLRARQLRVTLDADIVYANLSTCAVPSHVEGAAPHDISPQLSPSPIIVDYAKPPSQIFLDATLHILARPDFSAADLANLWNFHEPLPAETLHLFPRWTPNLRPCDTPPHDNWNHHLLPFCLRPAYGLPRSFSPMPKMPELILPPSSPPSPSSSVSSFASSTSPSSPLLPHLRLSVRATNYIAHLTPYTLSVEDLLASPYERTWPTYPKFELSDAARAIHSPYFFRAEAATRGSKGSEELEDDALYFAKKPWFPAVFDRELHVRRLAVLGVGVGGEQGLALVPAAAKEGDIVVAVGEEIYPMVISPRERRDEKGRIWGGRMGLMPDLDGTAEGGGKILGVSRKSLPGRALGWAASGLARVRWWKGEVGVAAKERRRVVARYLSRITEEMGEEWEFVGPVLVKHEGDPRKVWDLPEQEILLF